jgi:hypothetical protein
MNRFILTEEEKKNISNLHKRYVTEQTLQDTIIQPGVFNQKVLDLQKHLITKFGLKIVPDGKLGPKTLAAVQTALKPKSSKPVTPTPTNAQIQTPTNTSTSSVSEPSAQDLAKWNLKTPEEYFNDETNQKLYNNSLKNKLGLN